MGLIIGCGAPATTPAPKSDGHSHASHAAPKTLGEAVHELEEMRDSVKSAFEAGNPESAHGALHGVGAVLTAAEKLVETGAHADHRAEAAAAVEGLFEAFGKLDDSLHSNKPIAYSEVEEQIDSAMNKLEAACPAGDHDHAASGGAEHSHGGHSHGDADHDHADHGDADHDHEGHDHGADEMGHAEPPAG